jgi:hypothetical protein
MAYRIKIDPYEENNYLGEYEEKNSIFYFKIQGDIIEWLGLAPLNKKQSEEKIIKHYKKLKNLL